MKANRPILKWIEANQHQVIKLEGQSNYTILHYADDTKEVVSYPNKKILPLLGQMIRVRKSTYIREELLQTNQFSRRLKRKYKNEKSIITNIDAICA